MFNALVKFNGRSDQNVWEYLVTFEKWIWQSMAPGRARAPVKALNRARVQVRSFG